MSLAPTVEGNSEARNGDYKFERFPMEVATIRVEEARLQWMQLHYYSLSSHSLLLRQLNVPNFVWILGTSGFDSWKGRKNSQCSWPGKIDTGKTGI